VSLLLWSRIWSPLVPVEETCAAWRQLGLPGDPEAQQSAFLGAFHYGAPQPVAPLLLHHTLNMPGDGVREDWMRTFTWLGLRFREKRLPPDHLAIACEIVAVAAARGEDVLVGELRRRYLLPWCAKAGERLSRAGDHAMRNITECFAADLVA
jgi:hypothetical protein